MSDYSFFSNLYESVTGNSSSFSNLSDQITDFLENYENYEGTFTRKLRELFLDSVDRSRAFLVDFLTEIAGTGRDISAVLMRIIHETGSLYSYLIDILNEVVENLNDGVEAILSLFTSLVRALGERIWAFFKEIFVYCTGAVNTLKQKTANLLFPFFGAVFSLIKRGLLSNRVFISKITEILKYDDTNVSFSQILGGRSSHPLLNYGQSLGIWAFTLVLENLRRLVNTPDISIPYNILSFSSVNIGGSIDRFVSFNLRIMEGLINETIAFFESLISLVRENFDLEWILLQIARFTPVGVALIIFSIALANPMPYIRYFWNDIESIEGVKTLRIKRYDPTSPNKHKNIIVFSDIHRDSFEDGNAPFHFGSVDHFLDNRTMYLELVKHYDQKGYTIIEAGDCEELWFFKDFTRRPKKKLEDTIRDNQELYDLLAKLHREGRYYRVYGNHDSYLRQPDVFSVMQQQFGRDFEIFDFIIIDEVKNMQDKWFIPSLDSAPNAEFKPLIITHGHQWDFWNCDENNLIGKLIVSAIVTPMDMLDDPWRDLEGLSSYGSPLVDLRELLAGIPVYDNWLVKEPAKKLGDDIQHKPDKSRRLLDSIMYSETLASLLANIIAVKKANGEESYFNMFMTGHTHNPQNQPYYDLKMLPGFKQLGEVIRRGVAAGSAGLIQADLFLVKSNYLNTGTSGWSEKLIWAIDIGEISGGSGQCKLVYWTEENKLESPFLMDWELPYLSERDRRLLADATAGLNQVIRNELSQRKDSDKKQKESVTVSIPLNEIGALSPENMKIGYNSNNYGDFLLFEEVYSTLLLCMLKSKVNLKDYEFSATIDIPPGLLQYLKMKKEILRKDWSGGIDWRTGMGQYLAENCFTDFWRKDLKQNNKNAKSYAAYIASFIVSVPQYPGISTNFMLEDDKRLKIYFRIDYRDFIANKENVQAVKADETIRGSLSGFFGTTPGRF